MTYALTVTGHTDDPELAGRIDEVLVAAGREVVEALREVGAEPSYASATSDVQRVNLATGVVESTALEDPAASAVEVGEDEVAPLEDDGA